jgi:hypothetical protein
MSDAVENAWKIHSAITDWTGKVDSKASFVLTIESALIAGVVTLSSNKRRLADLNTWWELAWYRVGIVTLVAAVCFVVLVVRPRLKSRDAARTWRENYIYFGHVHHWSPTKLAERLEMEDILPVLARQLVATSDVAWKKHRRLQNSVTLAVIGSLCVFIAAWLNG